MGFSSFTARLIRPFFSLNHLTRLSAGRVRAGLALALCLALCLALTPRALSSEWWRPLAGKKFDTGGGVLSFKLKGGELAADWIYSLGGGSNIELGKLKILEPYRLSCEYQDGELSFKFNPGLSQVKIEGTTFNPNASPIFAEGREKWQLKGKGAKLGSLSGSSADPNAWWLHLLGNKYDMGDSTLEFFKRRDKFAAEWNYISGYGDRIELSNFVAYRGNALTCDYQHGEITFHFSPDLGEVEVSGTSHHSQFSPIAADGVLSQGKRMAVRKAALAPTRSAGPREAPAAEARPERPAAPEGPVRQPQEPGGGGETMAAASAVGGEVAEPAVSPDPLAGDWWEKLAGRAYRLDNGQVLSFVMQGRLLTCEWGKLLFSQAGFDQQGEGRFVCLNCSRVYQIKISFQPNLEKLEADMGRLGSFTGLHAGKAGDIPPLGPEQD